MSACSHLPPGLTFSLLGPLPLPSPTGYSPLPLFPLSSLSSLLLDPTVYFLRWQFVITDTIHNYSPFFVSGSHINEESHWSRIFLLSFLINETKTTFDARLTIKGNIPPSYGLWPKREIQGVVLWVYLGTWKIVVSEDLILKYDIRKSWQIYFQSWIYFCDVWILHVNLGMQ